MLTLPELNDLPEISWHSGEAGGLTRTLSDFAYWTDGLEFTIVWDFDFGEVESQTQHVRIFRNRDFNNGWFLYTLEAPHGKALPEEGLNRIAIDTKVIDRIRTHSDAFAQGVPTRRFAVAFYGGDI